MHIKRSHYRAIGDFIKAIKSIPSSENTLCLSECKLYTFSIEALEELMSAIPRSITFLDLRLNDLYRLGAEKLIRLMKAIPLSVTEVDLDFNSLYILTLEDLQDVLKAIPQHVKHIGLSKSFGNNKTRNDLARYFKSILPDHIETVTTGGVVIHVKELKEHNRLGNDSMFPFFKHQPMSVYFHFEEVSEKYTLS